MNCTHAPCLLWEVALQRGAVKEGSDDREMRGCYSRVVSAVNKLIIPTRKRKGILLAFSAIRRGVASKAGRGGRGPSTCSKTAEVTEFICNPRALSGIRRVNEMLDVIKGPVRLPLPPSGPPSSCLSNPRKPPPSFLLDPRVSRRGHALK